MGGQPDWRAPEPLYCDYFNALLSGINIALNTLSKGCVLT